MKKTVVCLIGIDGSGKTSHVLKLIDALRAVGILSQFEYMRGSGLRFFARPFYGLARITGHELTMNAAEAPRDERSLSRLAPVKRLWPISAMADATLLILVRRLFAESSVIVSDRNIYDALVDLMVSTGDQDIARRFSARFFLKVTKPDLAVLLDVDEPEALRRKAEFPLIYLRSRRAAYRSLAGHLQIPIVDSRASFEKVHSEILSMALKTIESEAATKG